MTASSSLAAMILRRPPRRRSNSASENVSLPLVPLCRTLRRSSSAMEEALSAVIVTGGAFLVGASCSWCSWLVCVVRLVCGARRGLGPWSEVLEGLPGGFGGEEHGREGHGSCGHEVPAGCQLALRQADEQGGHEGCSAAEQRIG